MRMTTRKRLYEIAMTDATVAAYLNMADYYGLPWGSTMERLVVALAHEKRAYYNQAVDAVGRSIVPIVLPLNDPKLGSLADEPKNTRD